MPSYGTIDTRQIIGWAGGILAVGCFGVVITSLLYAVSPSVAALPIPSPHMANALEATILGRHTLMAAGMIGVVADILLIAGALLLMVFRPPASLRLERFGWALVAISVTIFVVVDALAAGVLSQVARHNAVNIYADFKSLFDICFVLGAITFGMGAPMILASELRAKSSVLPRGLAWAGVLIALTALTAGILYFTGVDWSKVVGITTGLVALLFGVYGLRIARSAQMLESTARAS